jgi:hypothetical protein
LILAAGRVRPGDAEEASPEDKVSGAISDAIDKGSDILLWVDGDATFGKLNEILIRGHQSGLIFEAIQNNSELRVCLENFKIASEERLVQPPLFGPKIIRAKIVTEEGQTCDQRLL